MDDAPITGEVGSDIYVQPLSRLWGIKVHPDGATGTGTRLRVRGVLKTGADCERYIEVPSASRWGESPAPSPVAMTLKSLGGSDWKCDLSNGAGQKGVKRGVGLNNLGLLVRVCGSIKQIAGNGEDNWFLLDDGSGPQVKVSVPPYIAVDSTWNRVIATGISSCEMTNGEVAPVLRIRNAQDIVPME